MGSHRKILEIKSDLIKGSNSSKKVFYNIKSSLNYDEIRSILNGVLLRNNIHSKFFHDNLFSKNYKSLSKCKSVYYDSFEKELIWNAVIFEIFSSEINVFLEYKDKYEKYLILGHFEKANEIIDKIEKDICVSFWSLEQRFVIKEHQEGLEKNREFLSYINNSDTGDYVKFFADLLSFKAEKNISAEQYNYRINQILKVCHDEGMKAYLSFKFLDFSKHTESEYTNILFFESISTIIDRYLTFIKIIQEYCAYNKNTSSENTIKMIISNLSRKIEDDKIRNLRLYFNPNFIVNSNSKLQLLNEIIDLYTNGLYDEALNLCQNSIIMYPNIFELYEIMVKSMIYSLNTCETIGCNDSILNDLLKNMYKAYTKKEKAIEAQSNLLKLTRILCNNGMGTKILCFISSRFMVHQSQELFKLGCFNASYANPRFSLIYDNIEESKKYLLNIKTIKDSVTIKLFESYFNNSWKYDDKDNENYILRIKRYKTKAAFNNNNYDNAINELLDLINEDLGKLNSDINLYLSEKISLDLFNVYLATEEYEKALQVYIDNYLYNSNIVLRMDKDSLIQYINNQIKYRINIKYKSMIELPILSKICYGNDHQKVYSSYANYLASQKISKPSELIGQYKGEQIKLVYFLKNICKMEILDSTRSLNNNEKVEGERIIICQYLSEVDKENKLIYDEEISNIIQLSDVKKRIREVDERKIDINIEGIKEVSNDLFEANFNRYKKIREFKNSITVFDPSSKIIKILSLESENDGGKKHLENESRVLFYELFRYLRDEFLFNQYGLNSSLSTRIRHGTLQNQLRSDFEANKIITSKSNENSNEYDKNEYWKAIMISEDRKFKLLLQKCLSDFSREIDNKINYINQEWMQIKTENHNTNGLFDYYFTSDELGIHAMQLQRISESSDFFNYIIGVLLIRTETCLKNIRDKMIGQITNEFLSCLSELETKIKILGEEYNVNNIEELINKIINCRTKIQSTLLQVSEWFRIPEDKENSDFNMNQLINTCINITTNLYPEYKNIDFDTNINCRTVLKGNYFQYFVDIFKILFGNVIDHCNKNMEAKDLNIKLDIHDDDNYIIITLQNNLHQSINLLEKRRALEELKAKMNDKNYILKVTNREGKSGYAKIVKIIYYNLKSNMYLDFNVNDDYTYKVNLNIGKQYIVP